MKATDTYPSIPGELVQGFLTAMEGMMSKAGEQVLKSNPQCQSWHRTKGSARHHLRRYLGLMAIQSALEMATDDEDAVDRWMGTLAEIQQVMKGDSPDVDSNDD